MGFEWQKDGLLITFSVIRLLMDGVAFTRLYCFRETSSRQRAKKPLNISLSSFFIYLGGSSLIASNSDMDFFLKHGAKSSSSKSP